MCRNTMDLNGKFGSAAAVASESIRAVEEKAGAPGTPQAATLVCCLLNGGDDREGARPEAIELPAV